MQETVITISYIWKRSTDYLTDNQYCKISVDVDMDNEHKLTVPLQCHAFHRCHYTSHCAQNDRLLNAQMNAHRTSQETASKLTHKNCLVTVYNRWQLLLICLHRFYCRKVFSIRINLWCMDNQASTSNTSSRFVKVKQSSLELSLTISLILALVPDPLTGIFLPWTALGWRPQAPT